MRASEPCQQQEPTCDYGACWREPMEGSGFCYAHQPKFVVACTTGEHCVCYEDGHSCCTCGLKRAA